MIERTVRIGSSSEDMQDDGTLVDSAYFRSMLPTRKQMVEAYLGSLNAHEQESANMYAKDLYIRDKPLNDTVVLIPIAAHQEAGNIENAMDQYAAQEPRRPFSVMLYPNYPEEASQSAVDKTVDQIRAAQHKHPYLDIRTTLPDMYCIEPRIGTIRRTLWNAALLLAHYDGKFDDPSTDVTGLNHDIDLIRLSPRYIARVQDKAAKTQAQYERIKMPHAISRPYSTFVKHATDPQRPNVSRAAFWNDFSYWQLRPRGSYDAGLVLPMSYYAQRGGITQEAVFNEMAPMLKGKDLYVIPGTVLETSPRRFAERLQANDLNAIWSEDSFGADDKYRTDHTLPDISDIQLESVIANSLDDKMDLFFNGAIHKYQTIGTLAALLFSREENMAALVVQLERKKRLAATVLDRYVGVPQLARIVEQKYDTVKIAEKVVGDDD